MPKFTVTIAREYWESAAIEIEADEEAAETAALKQAQEIEDVHWKFEDMKPLEVLLVDREEQQ